MRKFGQHPSVSEFIVELIAWKLEKNRGLDTIPITEWMARCLKEELGGEVRSIDEVPLRVVPHSDSLGVEIGLQDERNAKDL